MGYVDNIYSSLNTKVDVVEFLPRLLTGADEDLVQILEKRLSQKLNEIIKNTKVTAAKTMKSGVKITMESEDGLIEKKYDKPITQ